MDKLILIRGVKALIFSVCIFFAGYSSAEELSITQVSVSPVILTSATMSANIRFNISKPSLVVVKIFDALDELVWRSEPSKLSKGVHSISWPGHNNKGAPVTPEAYFFVIEAKTEGKESESVVYDMTDITGGENLQLQNIHYDSKTHKLTFTAPKTGRYILRAGIARAFAIDTLINNNIVTEGSHEITWDGYDVSRAFNSANHPNLQFGGMGYQLNANAIVVVPVGDKISEYYRKPASINSTSSGEFRENKKVIREHVSPNFYRAVNQSRDVPIIVHIPESVKRNKNNAYIIQKMVPIRIDLLPEDIMVMEAQRGEIVLFLDGQLIHDNEVSYYPYTFNWNPQIYDDQEHLLTVFVAGFAGNIGMNTIKVHLKSL